MELLNPKLILSKTSLKIGDTVVDYASGSGHWSIFAAKLVGSKGHVFSIENNFEVLKMIEKVAEIRNVHNVVIEEVDFEGEKSKLAKAGNLVIVSNILYLIKNRDFFAKNAAELVCPGGELLFIDWDPKDKDHGPDDGKRVGREEAIKLFEKGGLVFDRDIDTGWYHYGLILKNNEKVVTQNEKKD